MDYAPMQMWTSLLSRLISRLRGSPFILDPALPLTYLLALMLTYFVRRVRGKMAFPFRRAAVFLGRRSRLIGRSCISLNGTVNIGDDCIINAVSTDGISFGSNVSVQRQTAIECTGSLQKLGKGVRVGNNVGIGTNSFLGAAGGIDIGDDTIIGNFVSFHSQNHVFVSRETPIRLQGVSSTGIRIGRDCWIGSKVTILDGVDVGDGCVIAAGAVLVAGYYEPFSILGGVPARKLGVRGA